MPVSLPNSVAELAALLQNNQYTERTEEERRQTAERMYANQRDQALLNAQQTYDANANALNNQLNELNTNYANQIANQQRQNALDIASADRRSIGRGMQRSSYNGANLANMAIQGERTINGIEQNRTNDVNKVNSQLGVLANQLAQNQASANSAYENNVLNYMEELRQEDYSRRQNWENTNNQLLMNLYNLQQAAMNRASSGGSSGGRTGTGTGYTPPATDGKGDGTMNPTKDSRNYGTVPNTQRPTNNNKTQDTTGRSYGQGTPESTLAALRTQLGAKKGK